MTTVSAQMLRPPQRAREMPGTSLAMKSFA